MLEKIESPYDLKKISQKDLITLCQEIRDRIVEITTKNGGHLSSNLGVIELTTAIHYVFDSPKDTIIFDVGHQCYTHKILTGRNKNFDTIRTKDGLSGFTRIDESPHDAVNSGHSSSSISSAVGFAIANHIQQKGGHIVVIIGDGALTGGEAFEGLNFIGQFDNIPITIILNNNNMSIGKNVGALYNHMWKLTTSRPYQKLTGLYKKITKNRRGFLSGFFDFAKNIEKGLKLLLGHENIFMSLGFEYIGAIDGHNINDLIKVLKNIKENSKWPTILHVNTMKGKGHDEAELDPSSFHGVTPKTADLKIKEIDNQIEHSTDKVIKKKNFTSIFSEKIVELAREHKDIITITAAMEEGTGLTPFKKEFPDRMFDVGIAEQHAVTFAAGLALNGLKPFFAIYSTFLARAIDQLIQDVAISRAPVVFIVDRAGIVGLDGETHQGQFDISLLRAIPNIEILAPFDEMEFTMELEYAYKREAPVVIRFPKDKTKVMLKKEQYLPLETAKILNIDRENRILNSKKETLFLVIGPFLDIALKAKEELEKSNISVEISILRFLKPLPIDELTLLMRDYKSIVVIEESAFNGSVSSEIPKIILENGIDIKFTSINIPDKFISHNTREATLIELGFTAENLVSVVKNMM